MQIQWHLIFLPSKCNEINGWSMPSDILKDLLFILKDKDVEILKNTMKYQILLENRIASMNLYCKGNEISKNFDFICIGDWVSFYLAILNM